MRVYVSGFIIHAQAMIPFDEEELAYVSALDPDADVELLRRELPSMRDSCLRTLEVSTTLLKASACSCSPPLLNELKRRRKAEIVQKSTHRYYRRNSVP